MPSRSLKSTIYRSPSLTESRLQRLSALPFLEELLLQGCPIYEEYIKVGTYRIQVIGRVTKLQVVDHTGTNKLTRDTNKESAHQAPRFIHGNVFTTSLTPSLELPCTPTPFWRLPLFPLPHPRTLFLSSSLFSPPPCALFLLSCSYCVCSVPFAHTEARRGALLCRGASARQRVFAGRGHGGTIWCVCLAGFF